MVKKVAVHVAEDPDSNMFITTKDLETRNVDAFILSGNGLSAKETAGTVLQDKVTHKYSGVYTGTESELKRSLLKAGDKTEDNKAILQQSGVKRLKKGKGKTMKVAGAAGLAVLATAQGLQLQQMFSEFSADGVVNAGEWAQLTGEAVVGRLSPVADAFGDFWGEAVEVGPDVGEAFVSGLLGIIGLA